MLNNLEGIGFDEVTDTNGIPYSLFREELKPYYTRVLVDILKGYGWLVLISTAIIILTRQFHAWWWITSLPGAALIGYTAAYLALFIHEAGHFNIYPDKKINDRLATLLLCLPFGLSLKSYRKVHWQHHVHLGTPDDAEVSYFNALSKLFFVETLTGIHLLKTMRKKNGVDVLTPEQQTQSRYMLFAGIVFHLAVVVVSFLTGNWPFALSWIAGFGIFFPFFATIRQVLEHRDELASSAINYHRQNHGKVSRLFANTLLSSSFGSAGFTRHMIHHWDPHVSYTRLKDIEEFLARSERTASIIKESKTSYRTTLKKLLRAS